MALSPTILLSALFIHCFKMSAVLQNSFLFRILKFHRILHAFLMLFPLYQVFKSTLNTAIYLLHLLKDFTMTVPTYVVRHPCL